MKKIIFIISLIVTFPLTFACICAAESEHNISYTIPVTGDNASVWPIVIFVAAAVVILAALLLLKKKK